MQLHSSAVKFETIREIEEVESALNTYLDDHPEADNEEKIEEFRKLLEEMHKKW